MTFYKCPWCSAHSFHIDAIKKHIKRIHEDLDHWALWINEKR